jgi:hypothetical protein
MYLLYLLYMYYDIGFACIIIHIIYVSLVTKAPC